MSSFFNPTYFQTIINLIQGRHSILSTFQGMFWQAFYAVVGCVIGAAIFGHIGAFIGTIIGAWFGFKSVNPYHSLVNQLNELTDEQKQMIADEIRRAVGSSSADNLINYALNGNGKQLILDIIQRYLNRQSSNINSGIFSRFFS